MVMNKQEARTNEKKFVSVRVQFVLKQTEHEQKQTFFHLSLPPVYSSP